MNQAIELSIVVPVFNEQDCISPFIERLEPVLASLGIWWELVFINDGSTDETFARLIALGEQHPSVMVVDLSRNFGKEAALTAGLHYAKGAAVVCIDVDLQDPPELIVEFVRKWREGYQMVYGVRTDRRSDTFMKRLSAGQFYRMYNRVSGNHLPMNAGDFRLLDRKVVEVLRQLPERSRFMKGLFSWAGFKQVEVPYARAPRAAGRTKWNYWRLWNFALDGIVSFSTVPLKIWSYLGIFVAGIAFVYALIIIGFVLVSGIDVPGYASLIIVVLFLGGVNLIGLGVLGEYVARIFVEVKGRPIYVVDHVYESNKKTDNQSESIR